MFNLTGGSDAEYPGTDEVTDMAGEGCIEAFEPFVGVPFDVSVYQIDPVYPSEASWRTRQDREVLCLIRNEDNTPKTGTARDTAR